MAGADSDDHPDETPDRANWLRKIAFAVLLVSPSILGTVASWTYAVSIDRKIEQTKQESETLVRAIADLDQFTQSVEQAQLYRVAFLLMLDGMHAEQPLKLKLDQWFRANAMSTTRRVAASVYPADWRARMEKLEAMVSGDYTAEGIPALQEIENTVDRDARATLTALQAKANDAISRKESLESVKTRVAFIVSSFGYILTIFAFLLKESRS